MFVLLLVHDDMETLFLSIKASETRFLPPPILSKWRGLRGLGLPFPSRRAELLAGSHDATHLDLVIARGTEEREMAKFWMTE